MTHKTLSPFFSAYALGGLLNLTYWQVILYLGLLPNSLPLTNLTRTVFVSPFNVAGVGMVKPWKPITQISPHIPSQLISQNGHHIGVAFEQHHLNGVFVDSDLPPNHQSGRN